MSDTLEECVHESHNISSSDEPEKVLSKMLLTNSKDIHGCLEEENLPQDEYARSLLGLVKLEVDHFTSEVAKKQVLAIKHMINMSAEMERRNFGRVSETTKALQAKYSEPMFEVTFPDINLLGISEDATDVTQFSMKIINLSVIALIAYMFLRLLLK